MQATLIHSLRNTEDGKEAERILRSCVHCGFCTATCPTYQLLGDELDGPRGRIYLIKSMLEGNDTTGKTMTHLDRCLTCRACETTCPSGVEYGKLLDIGRNYVEKNIVRKWHEKLYRYLILHALPYRNRFSKLLKLGEIGRVFLPAKLKRLIPVHSNFKEFEKAQDHSRKVILFGGCVQPDLAPEINNAVKKVLNHFGVTVIELKNEQCCGALSHHLAAEEQAKSFMRKNIDQFHDYLEQGAEAVISSASGCGVHIKEYAYLFRNDKNYADKAEKVSLKTRDIGEYLQEFDLGKLKSEGSKRIAFQCPCTLQHGQQLSGVTENVLSQLGFTLTPIEDSHLCCGSAGVYSLLQKDISAKLQSDKINKLMKGKPDKILTANIGCRQHLQQVSSIPVQHWIEEVAALID